MINFTKLYGGHTQSADAQRYGQGPDAPRSAADRKPIVVWNITRRCNLHCLHCYSDSTAREYPGELTFEESCAVVDDLAEFGVPALLLSGGEPLIHPRFFDLASYAVSRGLRLTLSTNGTLIDDAAARRIQEIGFSYVGISLDGIGKTHDHFRGKRGAFARTVAAFSACKRVNQKVGLRLTLSRTTIADLPRILDFIETVDIDRVCFYHLVSSGRGSGLAPVDHEATRRALDMILDRTALWIANGTPREVLTVDQPADGAFLLRRMAREGSPRLGEVERLLRWNGGGAYGSGVGIGNIDPQGEVHPDQFWQTLNLGNVREKPFSEIWRQSRHPMLSALRNRLPRLQGRCARCRYLGICGGGFRVRAEQLSGNPWEADPGCYLTDEEVLETDSLP